MSNLWFFRLKRAEQQRRRSSGEQSLGSASLNSSADLAACSLVGPRYQLAQSAEDAPPESSEWTASSKLDSASDKMQQGGRVPTVNIIRSDSMLSCASARQVRVSLLGAQTGSVESELVEQPTSGEPPDSRVSSRRQVLERELRLRQKQASDIERRASNTSSEFNQRDQLESGKVPPIRPSERSLLNPAGPNLADSMDNLAALIPRVRVEFYNSENTLKEQLQMYFIKDHTASLYLRSAKLILKVLACYLYVFRVILDRGPGQANCYGCSTSALNSAGPKSMPNASLAQLSLLDSAGQQANFASKFDSHPYEGPINFRALFWVDRGPVVWTMQTTIAVICFIEALLMQYLTYKNSIFSIISFHFTLELVTNSPFIISIFWPELRTLFVPAFLNCWLAKQCLEAMLNDLSIVRQSSVFSHRLTILSATVFCLIFTSACGFQHTQRSGGRVNITIFESIYFVVVTFSTVGYGDFKPETWPSQLFIMVMICVALIVLPTQFEQLAYFWIERKKLGASYAHHSTRHEKHVVVCSTTLRADTIMDFLNEFYAHPLLQTFSVVLLSPCELDTTMKLVLQTPTWNNRVVYIQGSALKASDLIRARMQSAEACFILAARNYNDRSAADEHTILRSWAIRDFSPYVPQYVQIFRTENKIHVAFAEHVVCDDEFKYALLANNCLIPGTSTLVTLLLHTSQQRTRRRRRRRKPKARLRGATGCNQNPLWSALGSLFARRQLAFSDARGKYYASPANDPLCSGVIEGDRPDAAGQPGDYNGGSNSASKAGQASAADQAPTAGPNDHVQQQQHYDNQDNSNNHYNNHHHHQDDDDDEDDDEDLLRDEIGKGSAEWKRLYGKCSANEIYHIRLSDSRFFGEYQGKSFTYASFHSHRKFGVALIGVQTDMRGTWPIMLNPGPSYVLKSGDILFYINITKEENSTLMPMMHQEKRQLVTPSLLAGGAPPGAPSDCPAEDDALPPLGNCPQSMCSVDDELDAGANQQTFIRIESSSPTVNADGSRAAPDERFVGHTLEPPEPPKRHSVAQGAGIVARSLCSVAGIPGALDLPMSLFEQTDHDSDGLPVFGRDQIARDQPEHGRRSSSMRHRLGAGLLSKRNSSASTSAAQAGAASAVAAAASGLGVARNASTLELAALAAGLRKGSNMSITSTRSRDASPTRLKQVVSGLAVKMKRVKLGKSLTHLTIPRMDYGGSSASSTESFVNARGRRPSIAPVPAMMGESEEHDSDHEREQESYFAMSWQSSSESSPIVKKFVFCTTYVGVSPTLCYLLQRKKPACCLQLISACDHCPYKNARQYNWPNRCIILASDFASNGIYNFLVPLRAHFHNPNELRPIVLLLERKPSPQFIDAISWFPMVYWMPGSIDNLDDLIKAGINLAHSVVVTNKESTNSAEEDYLADCNTIVAVQTMFKMFPSVGIITELSQSSNMRFMQFRAHDVLFGGLSLANFYSAPPVLASGHPRSSTEGALSRLDSMSADAANLCQQRASADTQSGSQAAANAIRDRLYLRKLHSQLYNKSIGKDINSHSYKYRLPFAAGNVFSASMLDTLLYQAFVKDYMITMVRLLLGIDQAPGSGFLSSMRISKEDLWIRTYGRLYQRLCSTTCEIPLGIYRTEPLEMQRHTAPLNAFTSASQQASYEQATEELERQEISNMVKNRLQDLGMLVSDYDDSPANRNNTFSYVIINPNCDIRLREGDIIYLIRPSPIHSRKLFMHRANSVRHNNEQAPARSNLSTADTDLKSTSTCHQDQPGICRSAPQQTNTENNNAKESSVSDAHKGSSGAVDESKQQRSTYIKSCLSDGDFGDILIKVEDNNQPDTNLEYSELNQTFGDHMNRLNSDGVVVDLGISEQSRRRSSCSEAEHVQRSRVLTNEHN